MQYSVRNRRRLKRSTGAGTPLAPGETREPSTGQEQEIERLDIVEIVHDVTDASRR